MTSISSFTGSDLLAPMRGSLTSIVASGTPTTASAASQVLGSGAGYLQGAHETVAKLDTNIEQRTKALAGLEQTDPEAARREREQLELLDRLRNRIEQSIQRVGEILSGKDPQSKADAADAKQQNDDLDRLEARRRLLAQDVSFATPAAPDRVASTYAAQQG